VAEQRVSVTVDNSDRLGLALGDQHHVFQVAGMSGSIGKRGLVDQHGMAGFDVLECPHRRFAGVAADEADERGDVAITQLIRRRRERRHHRAGLTIGDDAGVVLIGLCEPLRQQGRPGGPPPVGAVTPGAGVQEVVVRCPVLHGSVERRSWPGIDRNPFEVGIHRGHSICCEYPGQTQCDDGNCHTDTGSARKHPVATRPLLCHWSTPLVGSPHGRSLEFLHQGPTRP